MIRVYPLPGEFAPGHLGRLRLVNCLDSSEQVIRILDYRARRNVRNWDPEPVHHLIGSLLGMDPEDYVRQHTLIPFVRVAAHSESSLTSFEKAACVRQRAVLSLARTGAYSCGRCIESDEASMGFSYWRRSHQLPGIDRCPEHDVPLLVTNSPGVFDVNPAESPQTAETDVSQLAEIPQSNETVANYTQIATRLLADAKRVSRFSASACLGAQARRRGLRVSMMGNKPLLSDFLLERFPHPWFEAHFPGLLGKHKGRQFVPVDGACRSQISHGQVYAMALAALFDKPSEAIEDFFMSPQARQALQARVRSRKEQARWELFDAYIACRGNHSEIARHLGKWLSNVNKCLKWCGLPSLNCLGEVERSRVLEYLSKSTPVEVDAWAERNIHLLGTTVAIRGRSILRPVQLSI